MVRDACQVPSALVPAARDSRPGGPARRRPPSSMSENTGVQVGGHPLLGEVQRVGAGQQREQPALVHAVVEQHLLRARARVAELAALVGVLHRDRQRHLGGVDRRPADAHPALHQGAEHGEEATVGVLDVGEVAAVLGDHGVPVEQVGARHPHAVEPQPAVVHAVEADLGTAVLDADAGHRRRPRSSRMRTTNACTPCDSSPSDQLGEHHRVARRAARRCRCSPCGPGRRGCR